MTITNIFLTRRTETDFHYFDISRDYPDVINEYQSQSDYYKNELSAEQWLFIMHKCLLHNPNMYFVFCGGNPLLYGGLSDILKVCHNEKLNYLLRFDTTDANMERLYQLINSVGSVRGIVAPFDCRLSEFCFGDSEHIPKPPLVTMFDNLLKIDRSIIDHVEIIVDAYSIKLLYNTVKLFAQNDIRSDIVPLDTRKSEWYDLFEIGTTDLLIPKNKETKKQFKKIVEDFPKNLLDVSGVFDIFHCGLPSDVECGISNLDLPLKSITIDSDGKFRLCHRIRGKYCPTLKLENVFDDYGHIETFARSAMKKDFEDLCKKCNYRFMIQN
jgi:radical SAM protein with 4Fe4S-binding SPASM domain